METNGRRKCEILKELRKHIAQENGITYAPAECNFEGECPGTCPKCEAELQYLQSEIDKKKVTGAKRHAAAAAVGGLLATSLLSCSAFQPNGYMERVTVTIDSSMVGQKQEITYIADGEDTVTVDSIIITEDMVGDCLEYPDSGSALWRKIEELKKQKAVKK